MNKVPYVPITAPFTSGQRAWLNGYLAGLFADAHLAPGEADTRSAPPRETKSLLVLYGSQTGNAEGLAKRFASEAEKHGCASSLFALNDYEKAELTKASRLIVVSSTWGDGDPPDNAAAFWSWLNSEAAPRLENLSYAVLGLGDRNYPDFCGASKKFDARLEQLGARRIVPRGECDVDYEATAKAWAEELWSALKNEAQAPRSSRVERDPSATVGMQSIDLIVPTESESGRLPDPRHGRNNPFPARLITHRRLTTPGSAKDTRHFEISLQGSGLDYEVGDALGVMPANCPALVSDILQALGCDGEEAVSDAQGGETALRLALLNRYQITQPATEFLTALAGRCGDAEWKALLDPARKADLDHYLCGREIIDFLVQFPKAKFAPDEFVALLRKLQPRLYSISSSPRAHPGEAHLTVGVVRYESHGRRRKGVCSSFLADRVEINQTPLPVFVQTSHGFRLPAQDDRPIIMIGPGTGIAPFRAFLEERRATRARGRTWLFFGDQCQAHDFLYREELETALAEGALTRLDTAFSRDQRSKIYVQHRMLENARELWDWLEDGAHVYVCGDARRMAQDVDAALHQVIREAGGKTAGQAEEYVQQLKTGKRYQRDVY